MGFSGIMEQKIQVKNMVRNYNPNSIGYGQEANQLLLSPE